MATAILYLSYYNFPNFVDFHEDFSLATKIVLSRQVHLSVKKEFVLQYPTKFALLRRGRIVAVNLFLQKLLAEINLYICFFRRS